ITFNLSVWFINVEFVRLLVFLFTAGFAYFTVVYFRPVLAIKPLSKFFTFARIRHATNASFIKGAKDGQKKFNAICIEPSW
ncbi:MAG: hypothetical protein AABZ14_06650, partial [Candidatus Margulisiibacteriota bacterium]